MTSNPPSSLNVPACEFFDNNIPSMMQNNLQTVQSLASETILTTAGDLSDTIRVPNVIVAHPYSSSPIAIKISQSRGVR
ncbi:hypothetical protein GKR41_p00027 (plasmid) [Candidatus Vallotia lariciata]|nr:hypothetical protein GKR41_p00027 [Candidatus Vallotia lariciata]